MQDKTIAFIGAGHLGTALIKGLIASRYEKKYIYATARSQGSQQRLASMGIQVCETNVQAVKRASIVVIAVPNADLPVVCADIKEAVSTQGALIVTVAAGVSIASFATYFAENTPIVRTLPNLASAEQVGMTALVANTAVNEMDKQIIETIFSSVGKISWLDNESDIDTVVALSGSGLAYFFLFMEALENAGVSLGLLQKTVHELVLQTATGAAKLAATSQRSLAELRESVTSPKGTTAAALQVLENGNLRELLYNAVQAANQRATDIAKEYS